MQAPATGDAPELVLAAILELHPRADDEILDSARGEHLATFRQRRAAKLDPSRRTKVGAQQPKPSSSGGSAPSTPA